MRKRKPLIFFMVIIAIVALFAASEVMAQGSCDLLAGISVSFDGLAQMENGNWLATYIFSGNKVSNLTSADVALGKYVDVVIPQGSSQKYAAPCIGALVGNDEWGKDLCEQRIFSDTPQFDPTGNKILEFEVTTGAVGEGGININATRGQSASCTITVPVYSLPGYAAVPTNAIVGKIKGVEYCADILPNGDFVPFEEKLPYTCDAPYTELAIDENFTFGNSGGLHANLTIRPGNAPRGAPVLAVGNPEECTWICFWGSCCGPIGPPCCLNSTPACP
jgi:hypothetical protein